jgi:2-keto-4-pentenoate hydratase
MTSDADVTRLARLLTEAHREGTPTAAGEFADLTIADGYAVQQAFVSARLDEEGPAVGYKLGFTNETVRREFGVSEPIYGRLLSGTVDVDRVATASLIAPRAEPELVVRLGERVPRDATRETVEAAVAGVRPAIEIVDTRTGDWDVTTGLAVADNALAARLVTGAERPLAETGPPADVTVELSAPDGDRTGRGTAVLGDPLEAVAWLSRTVEEGLAAGTLVSTGSLTDTAPVERGEPLVASFSGVGSVAVRPA